MCIKIYITFNLLHKKIFAILIVKNTYFYIYNYAHF
jgi:hypothetical protein